MGTDCCILKDFRMVKQSSIKSYLSRTSRSNKKDGTKGKGSRKRDESEDYEVEAIIDKKTLRRGKIQYLIKWKGWDTEDNTWESEQNLDCKRMIAAFNRKNNDKSGCKKTDNNRSNIKNNIKNSSNAKNKGSKKKLNEQDEYEVESIVDKKILKNGKIKYLVKWKGWDEEDNTWEIESNINSRKLIDEYNKNNPSISEGEESEEEESTDEDYEVEAIVDKRKRRGKIQYLVKWKGWDEKDNSWEVEDNLDCTELIEE